MKVFPGKPWQSGVSHAEVCNCTLYFYILLVPLACDKHEASSASSLLLRILAPCLEPLDLSMEKI